MERITSLQATDNGELDGSKIEQATLEAPRRVLVNYKDGRGEMSMIPPMYVENETVFLRGVSQLSSSLRKEIDDTLSMYDVDSHYKNGPVDTLSFPSRINGKGPNLAAIFGKLLSYESPKNKKERLLTRKSDIDLSTSINFEDIDERATNFARSLQVNFDEVLSVLTRYETHEVASDEIERTLDLMLNLKENAQYFEREIGPVAAFLPRNQPLYALACFALTPSLMASEVHVRAPEAMTKDDFFSDLSSAIELHKHFPNVQVSYEQKNEFVEKHSRLEEGSGLPITDVVIFTGSSTNADALREKFNKEVLFILNGAGHNPIVVTESANLDAVVDAALRVQLYNQGEDCASPNSILVHERIYDEFIDKLKSGLRDVKVGSYDDPEVRVGPIHSPKDLMELQKFILQNNKWLDPEFGGEVDLKTLLIKPTIITKPLSEGGNYEEAFGPVFCIQKYGEDAELETYFNNPNYDRNAMYLTLWGDINYVDNFIQTSDQHDETTLVKNTHLHAKGVERGVNPYGGFGREASNITISGSFKSKPTLPQRDIYEILVKPKLNQ